MGIQTLTIKGFRSLRDVTWAPGRLNVIIGPNGSGKSNLLRALELIHRSARGELPDEILRMGGMGPLLWDGQAQELVWRLRLDPLEEPRQAPIDAGVVYYELCLARLGSTSAYRVAREQLSTSIENGWRKRLERTPTLAVTYDDENRRAVAPEGSVPEAQTLLALTAGPFGNALVAEVRAEIAGWSIYHDMRVDQAAPVRQAAVARLDRRVAPDGQNLIAVLHTLYTGSREFKQLVDDAMRVAFGQEYEELLFPPAADQRVQLRVRWRSLRTEQSAADLSDGTLRFLLLLAILANPEPPGLIAIDEPEVGLHPSMLPLVAEHAVDAARRTQVILTTHSSQLLGAFSDTPPTTTVARWEEGQTQLSVIDGDELTRWLAEYDLGALFRTGELEGMA